MDMTGDRIDALCQRRCSFALYQEAGKPVRFCMQHDGGTSPWHGGDGFVLTTYEGQQSFLVREREEPPDARLFEPLPPPSPPEPATSRAKYRQLFSLYSSWLHGEHPLGKAVLARTADRPAPGFSPARAFQQASLRYPSHFNALLHGPWGTWLCSTPELLLSGQGDSWQTMALAGTRLHPDDGWNAKNKQEHGFVVRHIAECLHRVAESVQQDEATTLDAGQLQHLCTRFRFHMPRCRLQELLEKLSPTPAVCGYPASEARGMMAAHPDMKRGCYAGYLGSVSPSTTRLYVMLRCMQVFPGFCRLYAGGGLMPDSLEAEEWAETEAKMQPMLHLL